MVSKHTFICFIALGLASVTYSQNEKCILETAKSGELVSFRGEASSTDHDIIIRPKGCPKCRIILTYGDDRQALGKETLNVRRDDALMQFERYLQEQIPSQPNETCKLCPRYRVFADFEGRLDKAASAGLKKDPKSGKVIGTEGFGHPLPYTRYRIVVTRLSNVQAVDRER
jgi:hypothetical protein